MTTRAKVYRLFKGLAKVLAPPPKLTVSEWADRYRKLSPEASAEPGQWRTNRAPFQKEVMDAINDPNVFNIVLMFSAQVGKTEVLLNAIGYFVDHDPSPIMLVQPTEQMAEAFSKDRLAPMLRDTPTLRNKVRDVKSRTSGNTLMHKKFPGGHITLAGSNAPSSLASRPIRIVLLDEVDRYPISAGTEGDPVNLVTKRTTTFWNRKRIMVSTPTIKGASRIEFAYEESSMEQWCLPCPSCGEYQPLSWQQIKFDYDDEKKVTKKVEHACKSCGCLHNEQEWKSNQVTHGRWIARKENVKSRGFHLNELSSTFVSWKEIVHNFKEAHKGGQEMMKSWVNTSLGETWEEKGEQMDEEFLFNRREMYHADVPDGVKILTAAVDTQDNRFEVEVQGWGSGQENWRIQYHVIYGDLKHPQVWADLDEFLQKTWTDAEGRQYRIAVTCMDSGGHFTNEVYRFCKERSARRVFAIKGESSGDGTYLPLIVGTSTNNRYKATVVRLGVDEGKSKVMSALAVIPTAEQPKPLGYVHFPMTTPDRNRGYDRQYFEGLTSEVMQTRYKSGRPYFVWVKVRQRNEPLDLAVYNRAALEIILPQIDLDKMQPHAVSSSVPRTQIGGTTSPKRRRGSSSSI
ncbi:phage terminase large subunit family protein [Brevibacillus nitrificans]|uniref:phage terminase large subunit family protein n=1 Tax=Brevibacillus nitrificans TaxID=651560 RepID=UPI002861ED42|nr:phage terminase large subunit family protein [Brevibacillus nitrificans]MDR7318904.1 phage terminase large subunit GpA-like protein [Brevibacillus nitrificans]